MIEMQKDYKDTENTLKEIYTDAFNSHKERQDAPKRATDTKLHEKDKKTIAYRQVQRDMKLLQHTKKNDCRETQNKCKETKSPQNETKTFIVERASMQLH